MTDATSTARLPARQCALICDRDCAHSQVFSGQVAQIPFHLNRAMDNGLTKEQASEVLTHLAFYAGWPNVFSPFPVAKSVFKSVLANTGGPPRL